MICTAELAGRPTAELARVWGCRPTAGCDDATSNTETQGNTTNVRDETEPRRVTPGGVVGRPARERLPALLLFSLVPGRALCETLPAYSCTLAAARRQAGPGNHSRTPQQVCRQKQGEGGLAFPPFPKILVTHSVKVV